WTKRIKLPWQAKLALFVLGLAILIVPCSSFYQATKALNNASEQMRKEFAIPKPSEREQIEKTLREGIESKMGVKVIAVHLVRETPNKYTGFAETNDGRQIWVEATIDGDRYITKWNVR